MIENLLEKKCIATLQHNQVPEIFGPFDNFRLAADFVENYDCKDCKDCKDSLCHFEIHPFHDDQKR